MFVLVILANYGVLPHQTGHESVSALEAGGQTARPTRRIFLPTVCGWSLYQRAKELVRVPLCSWNWHLVTAYLKINDSKIIESVLFLQFKSSPMVTSGMGETVSLNQRVRKKKWFKSDYGCCEVTCHYAETSTYKCYVQSIFIPWWRFLSVLTSKLFFLENICKKAEIL